jgi:TolA-binding protein
MKKFVLIILTSFLSITSVFSQLNRAYNNLEKKDFDRSIELFNKVLEDDKQNGAALFGLALIYSSDEYIKKDLLKAWQLMLDAEERIKDISSDDLETISEYYVNTEERRSSRPIKKKMMRSRDQVLEEFIKLIREGNDLELVETVLEKFPDFKYYQNTVHIRNYLQFRKAEKQNSLAAYQDFIENFPDAAQIPQAKKQRNELAFKAVQKDGTFEAYQRFIKNYPDAVQIPRAIRARNHAAFLKAKDIHTIEAYNHFIEKYPNSNDVLQARSILMQLVYERAKKINTLAAYNDFISKYPEGNQYIDIFNLKTRELGKLYKQENHYINTRINDIRAYDNELRHDEFAAVLNDSEDNIYIIGNTLQEDTAGYDSWIIKLNQELKMEWNYVLGDERNNYINTAALDNNDNILIAGHNNSDLDTLTGTAWVFKLNKKGQKIWNKTLEGLEIKDLLVTNESPVITTYNRITADSVSFSILKLNAKGNLLWQRDYTTPGINYSLGFNGEEIFASVKDWMFRLDTNGFITWEHKLQDTLDVKEVLLSDDNRMYIATEDSNKFSLYAFEESGDLMWNNEYDIGTQTVKLGMSAFTPGGNILLGGAADQDAIVYMIDQDGNMQNVKQFGNKKGGVVNDFIVVPSGYWFGYTGKMEEDSDIILFNPEL